MVMDCAGVSLVDYVVIHGTSMITVDCAHAEITLIPFNVRMGKMRRRGEGREFNVIHVDCSYVGMLFD